MRYVVQLNDERKTVSIDSDGVRYEEGPAMSAELADIAKVLVRRDGDPLIDLDLRDVATVTADRTPGDPPNEAVRIAFRHVERLSTLHLRLKPSPWMVWRVEA